MIDVVARLGDGATAVRLEQLAETARFTCAHLGVERASVGLVITSPAEMAQINAQYRDMPEPTDVLSFPVDGPEALDWPSGGPPPELGDVLICPEASTDPLDVLVVHGVLHLLGYDHEVDDGEMLALQAQIVAAREARG
ncbi:MAG: rRNA maturation RNase YbeY [Thermoleophilia bacterium]|nr:rRNA maturation RNase YbeY [Thermoleophilia bacterium]